MAATTQVQVIVTAQDQATTVIRGIGSSFKEAAAGADSASASTSGLSAQMAILAVKQQVLNTANQAYLVGVGAVIAAVGVASAVSVKMASDFQSSMLLIQTQAGASSEELKNMTQAVLALAPAVGQSPQALAQGLFFIESAGFRGAKALDILKLSAEGAAVGHDSLADVSKALTSVLNSEIGGIHNATDAMGVMDSIVGHGKMTMQDLTGAISTGILPAAKQAGLSIQDLGAMLDVMTNNGIPAEAAATRLRMSISLMVAPSAQATKQLASIGLSSRQLADDMRNGGIVQAITDLDAHLNGTQASTETFVKGTKMTATQLVNLGDSILLTNDKLKKLQSETGKTTQAKQQLADQIKTTQDKLGEYQSKLAGANTVINTLGGSTLDAVGKAQLLTKAFGGARSGSTIELLTQQTEALKTSLGGIKETSENFAKSWQATQATNAQAMARLSASVQVLAIQWGTILLPAVTAFANFLSSTVVPAIQNVTKFFEQHRTALIVLIGVIVGLLAPAFIMVATFIATTLIPELFMLASAWIVAWFPVVAIVAAVTIVILLVATHLTFIKTVIADVGKFFVQVWKDILAEGQKFITWVNGSFNTGIKAIEVFFSNVWKNVTQVFNNFLKWVTATFGPAFNTAMKIVNFIMIVIHDIFVLGWFEIQQVMTKFVDWIGKTFGPGINLVFTLIRTYLQNEFNFWKSIWTLITNILTTVGNWLNKTFAPMINEAFTFIKGLLTDLGNFFTSSWNAITKTLSDWGDWLSKEFTNIISTTFDWIEDALNKISDFWAKIWNGIKSFVIGIAKDISGAIKSMINDIIGFFNHIISGVNSVGAKVPGFIHIPSIPTFQTGGIVPGVIGAPTLIMAHGGEEVVPAGLGRSAPDQSGGVTIQVNVGLYAGSDTEKRNIAKNLYAALQQLARSQHKTVAEYMGG